MVIDIHAHCLAQETLDELGSGARQFPSVEVHRDQEKIQLAFAGKGATRPVNPKLRHHPPRLEWMEARGIDLQLTGGWLDAFGYELPAEEGADWSRFLNEQLLALSSRTANVIGLATVPLQSGKLAAKVMAEAIQAGSPGLMIGTMPYGDHGNLDDPQLDEFWAAAAESGTPIIVHPMFGSSDARLKDYEMMNAVGRVNDVTTAIARLLFSGHLLRYPGLRVVASTGGGALPYALGRLARNYAAHPNQVADPVAGFQQLYFDSIVFQPDVLRFLVDKVGADRIMLGSDYPFPIGDPEPRHVIENSGFSDEQIDLMLRGVATELFKL